MTKTHQPSVTFLSLALLATAVAGCKDDDASTTTPGSPAVTPPPASGPSVPPTSGTEPRAASPASDAPAESDAPSSPASSAPAAPTDPGAAAPKDDAPAGKRESAGGVSWESPAGWSQGAEKPMRLATLTDGTAEIVVSRFPADPQGNPGGGLMANVNRFRSQVQLPPVASDAEAEKLITEVDVAGKKARVIDLKGEQSRNLIAMIPGEGVLYYFRMTGDNDVVGSRKDAFDRIVQSVRVE